MPRFPWLFPCFLFCVSFVCFPVDHVLLCVPCFSLHLCVSCFILIVSRLVFSFASPYVYLSQLFPHMFPLLLLPLCVFIVWVSLWSLSGYPFVFPCSRSPVFPCFPCLALSLVFSQFRLVIALGFPYFCTFVFLPKENARSLLSSLRLPVLSVLASSPRHTQIH